MKTKKPDGRVTYLGPYVYGDKTYSTKAEMDKAISKQRQIDKWEARQPEIKYTPFQKWLVTFAEEKELDLSEPVTAGDGSSLQIGDVLSAIMSAPASEQEQIKDKLVIIDFRNGDVAHFLTHLAKALSKKDKAAL